MNYTNKDNLNYEDKPEDWLNSALIFSQTLSVLLKENEGIVVELKGDAKKSGFEKVIVYNNGKQMVIMDCDPGLNHGQMCFVN